jgi:hypothetical protein
MGGQVVIGKSYRVLLERYVTMYRDLTQAPDPEEVFDRHFPNGEYRQLLDAARQEALEDQQRLRRLVKRGEWLW